MQNEQQKEVYDNQLRKILERRSEDWVALTNAAGEARRLDDHDDRLAKVTEDTGVPWYVLHDLLRHDFLSAPSTNQ